MQPPPSPSPAALTVPLPSSGLASVSPPPPPPLLFLLLLLSRTSALHHLGLPSPCECMHGSGSQAPAAPGGPDTLLGCPSSELSWPQNTSVPCSFPFPSQGRNARASTGPGCLLCQSWGGHQVVPGGGGTSLWLQAPSCASLLHIVPCLHLRQTPYQRAPPLSIPLPTTLCPAQARP